MCSNLSFSNESTQHDRKDSLLDNWLFVFPPKISIIGIPAQIRKFRLFISHKMREKLINCCKNVLEDLMKMKTEANNRFSEWDDSETEIINKDKQDLEEKETRVRILSQVKLYHEDASMLEKILPLGKAVKKII